MENIIKLVSEKTGITEAQAKTAVDTVSSYLKDKMPDAMSKQMDFYLTGSKEKVSDFAGSVKDIVGNMPLK